MRCDEFENRLNELLDRRIAPDDDSALCSHARDCTPCAENMAAHLALTAALREFPTESADETFPFAVMNRLEGERRVSIRRRWQQWSVTSLVTAAAVLIALALWRGGVNPTPSTPAPGELATSSELLIDYDRFAEETQQLATLITTRQLEVMNDLAEGIKPVASSFGAAFEALRRTLPSSNTPATSTTSS